MKKIILFGIVMLMLVLPLVSAVEPELVFKRGSNVVLNIPCTNEGASCNSSASCNISIFYPNSTVFVNTQEMTNQQMFFNYTLPSSNVLGDYESIVICQQGTESGFDVFTFSITENGLEGLDWGFMLIVLITVAFLIILAYFINPEYMVIKYILYAFSGLFVMLLPSSMFITTSRDIFYKVFMGLFSVLVFTALIIMIYWGHKKMTEFDK